MLSVDKLLCLGASEKVGIMSFLLQLLLNCYTWLKTNLVSSHYERYRTLQVSRGLCYSGR